MSDIHFLQQLHEYTQWRDRLTQSIEMYREWRDKYGFGDVADKDGIGSLLRGLRSDRIILAFVAEFSRGKTELINALFFAETGIRLLPSTPGRTTMCPTELFYDPEDGSYIRLLSIDTRLEDIPLNEYKETPHRWMQIDLDGKTPAQMQDAFKELVAVKEVSLETAKKLGLYQEEMLAAADPQTQLIEIPCWRHAQISFSHPLLKEGISILDTPGLNALGAEPELTLNMLPNAQAVIFVLAADTGVTKSDLDIWRNHVYASRPNDKKGLAVVMNKIDTLWDDLCGDEEIESAIKSQIRNTASILGIGDGAIFPVSAKQALLAKVKRDEKLLRKSRIEALEAYLSENVLKGRRDLIMNAVNHTIGCRVEESKALTESRLTNARRQAEEFRKVDFENHEMTGKLLAETRDEQNRYLANVENFQASRRVLVTQAHMLIDSLSPEKVNDIVRRARKEMSTSLTTFGMKNAMRQLFGQLRELLQNAVHLTDETRLLVKAIYKKFRDEHGFGAIQPQLFSIKKYQFDLEQLLDEGEAFRNSTSSTLMEQHIVVEKLYGSVVARARKLLKEAHRDASNWSVTVLSPLLAQIKDHKQQIESRLEMLRKISTSTESVEANIAKLEKEIEPLEWQSRELLTIMRIMQLNSGFLAAGPEEKITGATAAATT